MGKNDRIWLLSVLPSLMEQDNIDIYLKTWCNIWKEPTYLTVHANILSFCIEYVPKYDGAMPLLHYVCRRVTQNCHCNTYSSLTDLMLSINNTLMLIWVVNTLDPFTETPSHPPQNRPSRRPGSGKERSPRGGEQPAAGQRGQGRGSAAEPEHPSDRHHL